MKRMAVMIALIGALVVLALTVGERERKAEMRHVLFANSELAAGDLRACLGQGLSAKDMEVVVTSRGSGSHLELSSRGGRLPDKTEAEALRLCLSAR